MLVKGATDCTHLRDANTITSHNSIWFCHHVVLSKLGFSRYTTCPFISVIYCNSCKSQVIHKIRLNLPFPIPHATHVRSYGFITPKLRVSVSPICGLLTQITELLNVFMTVALPNPLKSVWTDIHLKCSSDKTITGICFTNAWWW